MCGVVEALVGGLSLLGGLFGGDSDAPAPPSIITHNTEGADLTVDTPPPPTATPTFGQKSAEDMQKDASADAIKKNKKGRSALRIDRDPTTVLPGAGQVASGTVVPKG